MNWKQALFLGGAVLVLAACADSTAPAPGLRQTKGTAAVKKDAPGTVGTATSDACGYSVSVGKTDDGTCGQQY